LAGAAGFGGVAPVAAAGFSAEAAGFAAAGGGVTAEVPPAIFSAEGFSPPGCSGVGDLVSSDMAQQSIDNKRLTSNSLQILLSTSAVHTHP
jgi:hypothetical protein